MSESLEALKSRLHSGELSVFDVLEPVEPEDYRRAVQQRRTLMALGQDPEVLAAFLRDLQEKTGDAIGGIDDIDKRLVLKGGEGRFSRMISEKSQAFTRNASLLNGGSFEACLTQYKALIGHVEAQWRLASEVCLGRNYPLAAFIAILVMEEIGKLTHLGEDLIWFDADPRRKRGKGVATNHRKKQLIGVLSGGLINARLDRVLGVDVVRRILGEAESGVLEKTRQSCLYVDIGSTGPVLPSDVVSAERGRELTILAGELMAEELGYFPWEFDRMLDSVVRFEIDLGMPEAMVGRSAASVEQDDDSYRIPSEDRT